MKGIWLEEAGVWDQKRFGRRCAWRSARSAQTYAGVPEPRVVAAVAEGRRGGESGVLEVQGCVNGHCARWSRRRRSKGSTLLVFGRPEELSGPARGRRRRGR